MPAPPPLLPWTLPLLYVAACGAPSTPRPSSVHDEVSSSAQLVTYAITSRRVGPIDRQASGFTGDLQSLFPEATITDRAHQDLCYADHYPTELRGATVSLPGMPDLLALEVLHHVSIGSSTDRSTIRAVVVHSPDYDLDGLRVGQSSYQDVARRYDSLVCRLPMPGADCFDLQGGEVLCTALGTPFMFEFYAPADAPLEPLGGNYVGSEGLTHLVAIIWTPAHEE